MDMSWGPHPHYPLWFTLTLLLTATWAVAGIPMARRSRFPLLTLSLPLWWSFGAVFFGLHRVAWGQSISGGGRYATAAGIAEAHIPLKWGFYAVTLLYLIYGIRAARTAAVARAAFPAVVPMSAVGLGAADYWLSMQIRANAAVYKAWTVPSALAAVGVAALVCVTYAAIAMRRRADAEQTTPAWHSFILAAFSLSAALLVRETIVRLIRFVMSYTGWPPD